MLYHRIYAGNKDYLLKVEAGKIFIKNQQSAEMWALLEGTGLPQNSQDRNFEAPKEIVEISVDDDSLVVISDKGFIYYWQFSTRVWSDDWGKPHPRRFKLIENNRGWAISMRREAGYEDIGNRHHTETFGVTSLYELDTDGQIIYYGDPWLQDFKNCIYTPFQGRVKAINLDASASTIFIIDENGNMFTRLVDFDTIGHDPLFIFHYTFNPVSPKWKRLLPAEEWRQQPRIRGKITRNIIIIQNGTGNQSRQLIVEGMNDQQQTGYYKKAIFADQWEFVVTNEKIYFPFLDNEEQLILTGGHEQKITGYRINKLRGQAKFQTVKFDLLQFNPDCSPVILKVIIAEQEFDILLFIRRFYFPKLVIATTIIPDSMITSSHPLVRQFYHKVFRHKKYNSLQVDIEADKIILHNKFYRLVPFPNMLFAKTIFDHKELKIYRPFSTLELVFYK